MDRSNISEVIGTPALAGEERPTRRGLIGKAMVAGLATVPVVGLLTKQSEAATVPTGANAEAFRDIRLHENDHVAFLKKALGANARPKPTFKNITTSNFDQFVVLSRAFENVGVGAYLAAAPAITSKSILAAAGSIALVEARHAGFLNVFSGVDVTTQVTGKPVAFDVPLTLQQVVNAISPYLVSLNGGPAASFKAGDDISILNFALLLEYLEAEYYNINVPKYFGG